MWENLPSQDWLSGVDVKFYESKINLNWKPILKSIMAVRTSLVPCTCSVYAGDSHTHAARQINGLAWSRLALLLWVQIPNGMSST